MASSLLSVALSVSHSHKTDQKLWNLFGKHRKLKKREHSSIYLNGYSNEYLHKSSESSCMKKMLDEEKHQPEAKCKREHKKSTKESVKVGDFHRCRWLRISSSGSGNLAKNTANKDTAVTVLYYLVLAMQQNKSNKKWKENLLTLHAAWRKTSATERARERDVEKHCTDVFKPLHDFIHRPFVFVFRFSL